jgi:hypothetical protein
LKPGLVVPLEKGLTNYVVVVDALAGLFVPQHPSRIPIATFLIAVVELLKGQSTVFSDLDYVAAIWVVPDLLGGVPVFVVNTFLSGIVGP